MKFTLVCSITGLVLALSLHNVSSTYIFKTKFFETKVDHFSFSSNATFQMRYLVNDTYWSKDSRGPIFFYAGNEGDITLFAQNTGFMWETAPQFKALLLFAEHRYYGQSLPFGNKSKEPDNLGFLSSSQALMDYVDLIASLQSNRHRYPVVVFGGSYGGMLAAWMRMKYPGTVAGAIASSAPIWQFTGITPCEAFNRVLTSAFSLVSPKCSRNIRKSWDAISDITKTDDGKAWLNSAWKLCPPLKSSDSVSLLKGYLVDMYAAMAMVNYPYPNDFLQPLPGHPVKHYCHSILDGDLKGKELLTALFKSINIYMNYTGKADCFAYNSSVYGGSLDDSMWEYQSCTEMVMPMCSDGKNDMFEPSSWNLTEVASQCYNQFRVKPEKFYVQNMYGGRHIHSASNIIFSNGLLDPWSSGGVLTNVSSTVEAVLLPEAAHHLDLRAANPDDPASVVAARDYYRYIIRKWISHDELSAFL